MELKKLNAQIARELFIRVIDFNQKKKEITQELEKLRKIGEDKMPETLIASMPFRSMVGLSEDFSMTPKSRIMLLAKAELHYSVTDFVKSSEYMHCLIVLHLFLKDIQEKGVTQHCEFPLTRMQNTSGHRQKTYIQKRIVATDEVDSCEIKFASEQSFRKLQNFCNAVIFVLNQELPIDKQFQRP